MLAQLKHLMEDFSRLEYQAVTLTCTAFGGQTIRSFYIEVKTSTGRPRKDQVRFHEFLTKRGIIHGIARSPDDAVKIVKEGPVGYGFKD